MAKKDERMRINLYFSPENDSERIVYEFLRRLPYGKKTETVVRAISTLAEQASAEKQREEKLLAAVSQAQSGTVGAEDIQQMIDAAIVRNASVIARAVAEKVTVSELHGTPKNILSDKGISSVSELEAAVNATSSISDEDAKRALALSQMFG